MASVTITIPNSGWSTDSSAIVWEGSGPARIDLGTPLSTDGNTTLFLGRLLIARTAVSSIVQIQLASSRTQTPSVAGPEFSSQMENSGTITCQASNGDALVLTGISDSTEPYQWTPSNIAAVRTFGATLTGLSDRTLVVTFNDNSEIRQFFRNVSGTWKPVKLHRRTNGVWAEAKVFTRRGGSWVQVSGPQ